MATQTANAGLREYELIYVLRPTVDNDEAERVNAKVSEVVGSFGGKLTKLDNWGRRRLAYPMKKFTRGLFVYTKYVSPGTAVAEIERNLRITDSVLRHQTTLVSREVDLSAEIDPEELKFAPVEEAEPEQELNLEQRLGLAPVPRPPREGEGEGAAPAAAEGAEAAPAAPAEGGEAAPAADAAAPAAEAAPAAAPEAAAEDKPAEPAKEGGES